MTLCPDPTIGQRFRSFEHALIMPPLDNESGFLGTVSHRLNL